MINIDSNSNRKAYGIKHFNLDEITDLTDLNKNILTPGSTVFIISSSKYYMLNGSKKWIEINPFSLSSSNSNSGNTSGDGNSSSGGSNSGVSYDGGSIDNSDPV